MMKKYSVFFLRLGAVKKLYFDPREPATIVPIASKLYKKWANINRRNVRVILQSLETYQLNRGRRRPPDIKNRMFLKNPGMLAHCSQRPGSQVMNKV